MNQKTLIIGIVIGFAVASPWYVISNGIVIEQAGSLFFSLFFLLIGAVSGALICYFAYRRLLRSVLDFTNSSLERVASDVVTFVFATAKGDAQKAEEASKQIASRLGARLSDLIFVRGLFYTITSILVAVGTTFGTIVLIQQNHLIENQTKLLNVQTIAAKFAQKPLIDKKVNELDTLIVQLTGVLDSFDKMANDTFEVTSRSLGVLQDSNTKNFKIKNVTENFRIVACEKRLSGKAFDENEKRGCLDSSPSAHLKLIPESSFEDDINTVGTLSILAWFKQLSILHSQVDGATDEENRRYLWNFIKTARGSCDSAPERVTELMRLAKIARNLETSGSSLYRLFKYHYPHVNSQDLDKLNAELKNSSNVFNFNMLDFAIHMQNYKKSRSMTTDETLEAIKMLYTKLRQGLVMIRSNCENKRKNWEKSGEILDPLRNN